MNILLIEDEADLAAAGVAQLEMMGHTVAAVYDLAEARAFFDQPDFKIHLVIADHRLPDGFGIDFVLRMRPDYPELDFVIVSGCLTAKDTERLDEAGLPYYRKPLLYNNVIRELRRARSLRAPVTTPRPEAEAAEAGTAEVEAPAEAAKSTSAGAKSRFGFLKVGKRSK